MMGNVRAMGGEERRITTRRKKRIHHRGHKERRERMIKPESTAPDPRPTRKIGVWGTRQKFRGEKQPNSTARNGCATKAAKPKSTG
jgi:hypothetical protein